MNVLEIIGVISISVISTLLTLYGLMVLRKTFKTFSSVLNKFSEIRESTNSINNSFDEKELTEYEVECILRDKEFDNRIMQMKEELANQTHVVKCGTVAEELDPMVKNLPHNSVKTKYDVLPDIEVAE